MSINQLIFRNLKKNLKNYYLYVFALIFSAALYFAFVTLQYDPSMNETKGSIKGAAAIKSASVLLVAIVSIFLLYANNIFIKRRSKEIGLFQLIGMTKDRIFRILTVENFILYFTSLILGILLGFSVSKLIIMILFKVTGINAIATLHFSGRALIQTVIVFLVIYLFIMLMNYTFIKRQTILSLFRVISLTEGKVKKMSVFEIIIGIVGIISITSGYFISSKLFGGDFTSTMELFLAMIFILASVIIGTYLFYKGSVRFILNIIRKSKNGYLTINNVLSLSSIMFRMKSNALLLTIITTVSGLAIGLLSLSYISYYSAEKTAENNVPNNFSISNTKDADQFTDALSKNNIKFTEKKIDVIQVSANLDSILESKLDASAMKSSDDLPIPVISENSVKMNLSEDETVFTGYNDLLQRFMTLKESGHIKFNTQHEEIPQSYIGLKKDYIISNYFTSGGFPTAIVDDKVFNKLKADIDPSIQRDSTIYIGIDINDEKNLVKANEIFNQNNLNDGYMNSSRLEISNEQKQTMGLIMFIVGFLGLAFLITSGCILYFKQMDESVDEKPNYTILRKLGFSRSDLVKGIRSKQVFNFGIPLVVGLLHSYFAVQSGWFLFGTEVWTPMIIVMVLYTVLYSIFGILSVFYYKKVIKDAL
ncbi:FtsX-like permease family protein [Gottfriedia solisilvae]|uniref:Bacitracin export permease protein BceB n=1 Tax=Gottfriedia solisilvae TaxID=1516104 RepID=A0A8J3ANQ5_9BACI|nr:ABC transporter permease [Gottfriedia solisilvae]GGI16994.1 bacitracin export permease protein BceB [Gottfriedia solisilvae]